MKPISLPIRESTTITLKDGEIHNLSDQAEVRARIRHRISGVIGAAIAIEQTIVEVLAATLLGEVQKHRSIAVEFLLESDWCSFSTKRKLLFATIEHFGLLSNQEREVLNTGLGHVMRYRNAFAHGSIDYSEGLYILKYFEGNQRQATLDEDYWAKLETRFNEVWQTLIQLEVSVKRGA